MANSPQARVLGEKLDLCLGPISTEEPTGQNPKYEDPFVDLKGEIENIASGNADWKKIESLALEVVSQVGKDLNAMNYLAAALIQVHGLPGLADGFVVMRHWMEKDWDNLYPRKPPRARGFAFAWLVDRLTPYVEACKPPEEPSDEDRELLDNLRDDFAVIQQVAEKNLQHLAPAFGGLRNALAKQAALIAVPEQETQAEESSSPSETSTATSTTPTDPQESSTPAVDRSPETQAPAAQEAAPPVTSATGQGPKVKVVLPANDPLPDNAGAKEIRNRIRGLISPLRQSQLLNPTSYRLLRVLKWEGLASSPPADPGSGKTDVPAPRTDQHNSLKLLLKNNRWQDLLEASEAAFQSNTGTFWLDLQRYSVMAVEAVDAQQGPKVAQLIIEELRRLLERYPNLPNLTFSDKKTPFANQETKQWIEESVRVMEVESVGFGGGVDEPALTEEETEEVKRLFGKKKVDAAMAKLQEAIARAPHARAAFRARLAAAQLCLEASRFPWARTLLEQLRQQMGDLHFEAWDPETSAEVYYLLALCISRQAAAAEKEQIPLFEEDLAEVRAKLFQLDLRIIPKIEAAEEEKSRGWNLLRRS